VRTKECLTAAAATAVLVIGSECRCQPRPMRQRIRTLAALRGPMACANLGGMAIAVRIAMQKGENDSHGLEDSGGVRMAINIDRHATRCSFRKPEGERRMKNPCHRRGYVTGPLGLERTEICQNLNKSACF
jgi:hypothetical protein